MTFVLTQVEARVLGALIEKEITTPDYYPLSLNALLNACNQTSNRDPVTSLDEDAVRQALHTLQEKDLARPAGGMDSRVAKYEHHLESFNFGRREIAILCVLLLRGPQTPGELRGRTERLYHFDELSDVQSTLQKLAQREPSLVAVLPRRPGTKEARYAHLLCGEIDSTSTAEPVDRPGISSQSAVSLQSEVSAQIERITRLEEHFAALQSEVAILRQQLADAVEARREPA
ncbi:MAG: YceH family protein [Acidobacteriaceae bacterium]